MDVYYKPFLTIVIVYQWYQSSWHVKYLLNTIQ